MVPRQSLFAVNLPQKMCSLGSWLNPQLQVATSILLEELMWEGAEGSPQPPGLGIGVLWGRQVWVLLLGGACLQPQGQSHLGLYSLVALLMLSQCTLKLQGIPMTCGLHKLQGMGFSFRKCILRNTFTDFCPQNELLVSVCPVLLVQIMNSHSVTISISESITSVVTLHRCPLLAINDRRRHIPVENRNNFPVDEL